MRFRLLLAVAGMALCMAPIARAAHPEQDLIDSASQVLDDAKHDPAFAGVGPLLKRAQAIMILPALFKGSFVLSGEGGTGVLLTRHDGAWSQPAFYTLASASLEFSIGARHSEVVLIVLTDRGKRAFLEDKFILAPPPPTPGGAGCAPKPRAGVSVPVPCPKNVVKRKLPSEPGITVVTIGGGSRPAVPIDPTADIIAWTSSTAASPGLVFNGSVIEPRETYDRGYYGRDVSSYDIITAAKVGNPGSSALRAKLDNMAGS
jgi:lipid-binding SYLF domain-containing protein